MGPEELYADVVRRNPGEPEFHQAVREVLSSLAPALERRPELCEGALLERFVEPERTLMFRVAWVDDRGGVQVNKGYRIQFNGAIGPYKGGLRFHPTVTLGMLKFLGFEQTLKNSLTTLPMGGAKGGSDFDPKGKSELEVMRFCQAFMTELFRHVGADTDVPAGDIGVGAREVGYLYGMYRKLRNEFTGAFTGKGATWGGSLMRPEATGYGLLYFTEEMLAARGASLAGKTVAISGSGNVALHAAERALSLGGRVVTLSDSDGCAHDPAGIDAEKLAWIKELKLARRGRIREFAERFPGVRYLPGGRPWRVPGVQVALPCATQNELDRDDARALAQGGVLAVAEGANMPSTAEAAALLVEAGVPFAPGKAANAGGVATSGLEMMQNSMRTSWTSEEVDRRLRALMVEIHRTCAATAERFGRPGNLMLGANIAGFLKVATAMREQGVV